MSRIAVNGVQLNVEVRGDGPALLLLHGFTGSSATWTPHLAAWREFRTVAVDLIGHGDSDCPQNADRYRMERCVDDLTALLDKLDIDRAAVLGYSMGGRVALHLALQAPDRLWALVLESASPGIEDAAEREERARSAVALADSIERDGVTAFIDRWQAQPLFTSQSRLPEGVRDELRNQRLGNKAQGLANSLRGMGAGAQASLSSRLQEIGVPVLLLAGEDDEKYCRLARSMAEALPCARTETVPDAGHTIHLEQPDAFAGAVLRFLQESSPGEQRKERMPCH